MSGLAKRGLLECRSFQRIIISREYTPRTTAIQGSMNIAWKPLEPRRRLARSCRPLRQILTLEISSFLCSRASPPEWAILRATSYYKWKARIGRSSPTARSSVIRDDPSLCRTSLFICQISSELNENISQRECRASPNTNKSSVLFDNLYLHLLYYFMWQET